jgi:hypothetical protein
VACSLDALPDAQNVIYLVGAKFGTSGNAAATWTTNSYLPGRIARRYAGARISALSTGNVYPFVAPGTGGATEVTPPAPLGEYAMSCLGRERVLEDAAAASGSPLALIRLNYAVEMRYGVLIDLASAIAAGEAVDVSMGSANVVWQGYANEVILRALLHAGSPPFVLNLAGPETFSIRKVGEDLAQLLGVEFSATGAEGSTSLLSNATRCHALFGYPTIGLGELVEASAEWIARGGELLGKPTKFDRRDGQF